MFFTHKEAEDYTTCTDEEILTRSVSSPSLFKHIVERYEDAFRRKAGSILGHREEVEDVLQETFTRIYLNAGRFKQQEGATFSSWAYMILTNVSFTQYQKLKRRSGVQVTLDQEVLETLPELAQDEHGKRLSEEYVVSILVRMPALLSRVLTMHFLDDEPHKEIATKLGISVTAVKARIHRAKKEFRKVKAGMEARMQLQGATWTLAFAGVTHGE